MTARPNGHAEEPEVLDVAAIAAGSRHRTLRIRRDALEGDLVSPWELAVVGQLLELGPEELVGILQDKRAGSWIALQAWQGIAWIVARRVEPELSWEEARTYALEFESPPDPTLPRAARRSRRAGTATSSRRSA